MKISGYHKSKGDDVTLITSYDEINNTYERIYLSKVFTSTDVPDEVLNNAKISVGGSGFYYDKAESLPNQIEHHMPDYHLYDDWIDKCIKNGSKPTEFKYYTEYSIGFTTRGCFRKCEFCINKNYDACTKHSPIEEFIDNERPKICLLDDNFFACAKWRDIIKKIKKTNKHFQFKQGLDERLLTIDKITEMASWRYDGNYIFAFDDYNDKNLISEKLKLIHSTTNKFKKSRLKFYVLCGYDRENKYDEAFWIKDICEIFERCFILMRYHAIPYLMRHENYLNAPSVFKNIYTVIAAWCNQPSFFKNMPFDKFAKCKGMTAEGYKQYKDNYDDYLKNGGVKRSQWRYLEEFIKEYPDIADKYFHIKPIDLNGKY